ncbi:MULTISPECIES: transposase [unclassified Bradyrhizobium]|uniref:IS66 family transposase n=1 Tax=unclassified Bradyrhizobium TaxID=2631580 RepID=UPI002097F34A|nr:MULTISPECIES: transposase [unclassified Bradyrhizobium]
MADAGSVCTALDPLLRLIEANVMAAERPHADDTTVPVLAKGKTDTGRCWNLRQGRSTFWWRGSAGGDVLLLTRPQGASIFRRIWPAMPASCRRCV